MHTQQTALSPSQLRLVFVGSCLVAAMCFAFPIPHASAAKWKGRQQTARRLLDQARRTKDPNAARSLLMTGLNIMGHGGLPSRRAQSKGRHITTALRTELVDVLYRLGISPQNSGFVDAKHKYKIDALGVMHADGRLKGQAGTTTLTLERLHGPEPKKPSRGAGHPNNYEWFVVPSGQQWVLGMPLEAIPKGAVPTEIFYPEP